MGKEKHNMQVECFGGSHGIVSNEAWEIDIFQNIVECSI